MAPHTSGSCPSADVTLAYRLFGTPRATPVLFLHGMAFFSCDWVGFGSRLCSDRQGCAMDMRGFGDSGHSAGADYTVPTMAEDIRRLLDHLRWDQAILVAHSMGARSAVCFAARHPERVERLVLLDWSPESAPEGARRVAQAVAAIPDVFLTLDHALRHFGIDPASPQAEQKRARIAQLTRPVEGGITLKRDPYFREQYRRQLESGEAPRLGVDLWQALHEVASPVLAIRATRSDLFAAATVPKMLACNPRISVQEIEGGHDVAGDNPDAVLAAIKAFIGNA